MRKPLTDEQREHRAVTRRIWGMERYKAWYAARRKEENRGREHRAMADAKYPKSSMTSNLADLFVVLLFVAPIFAIAAYQGDYFLPAAYAGVEVLLGWLYLRSDRERSRQHSAYIEELARGVREWQARKVERA